MQKGLQWDDDTVFLATASVLWAYQSSLVDINVFVSQSQLLTCFTGSHPLLVSAQSHRGKDLVAELT